MTTDPQVIRMDLDGEITLHGLPPRTCERLRLKLSLPNPAFVRLQRFNNGFTGTEPERIDTAIELPDGSLHCPRGAIDLIREELAKDGLGVSVARDGRRGGEPIAVRPVDRPMARDYQQEGVAKIYTRMQGLIVLPCGAGKSRLGADAILRLGVTTLIGVHTADLADQWLAGLAAAGLDGGLIGNGRDERGRDVVVGIIASLLPILDADPTWGERFGFVIIDEAHHVPADTFQRVLRVVPAKYRIGLTATPDREDGLTRLVQWSFGPVLLERTTKEMIKLGYLMAATIEIVSTGWQWEHAAAYRIATQNDSAKTLQKLLHQLEVDVASDLVRNCGIADMVAAEALKGETCVVLVRTREHAKELAEMIVARGVEARALTGKVSKKNRKAAIDDLRAGVLPVAVATSLADEGLDLPRLSAVFLASPQRARGTTVQRLGRLLRLWEGKLPKLYDFVDDDVDVLASRATARRRVFKETDLLITESSF